MGSILTGNKRLLLCIFTAFSLLFLFFAFYGNGRVFNNGYDEGVYLLTAFQHARGQALYTELYLSQPPLLVEFFSVLISVFGANVAVLRGSYVLFSLVVLVSTFALAKEIFEWKTALFSVVLLELHLFFIQWGKLMNMNMPSLAFAILAVYCAVKWRNTERLWWVPLSAVSFAVSTSFKFLELFFAIPIAFILLSPLFPSKKTTGKVFTFRASLFRVLIYLAGFALPLLIVLMRYELKAFMSQAVIGLDSKDLFVISWRRAGRMFGNYYIAKEVAFFVLTLIGLWRLWVKDRSRFTFFIVWLVSQFLFHLLMSKWIWGHHLLALLPAFSILAGVAVRELLRAGTEWEKKRFVGLRTTLCIALLLIYLVQNLYQTQRYFKRGLDAETLTMARNLVEEIKKNTCPSDLVISDMQMACVWAERSTMPNLVDTSVKRVVTGDLPEGYLLEHLGEARMVIFWFDRLILYTRFHERVQAEFSQIAGEWGKEIYLNTRYGTTRPYSGSRK